VRLNGLRPRAGDFPQPRITFFQKSVTRGKDS
jgi:hypothetical protein